jgi:tetratricopeptide (TPR) repeat protein
MTHPEGGDNGFASVERQANSIIRVANEYLSAASDDPDSASGLLAAGKIWELAHVLPAARDYYQRALKADSGLLEAQARLALSQIKSGDPESGLRTALALAEQDSSYRFQTLTGSLTITVMTVLGDAFRTTGALDSATEAYSKALELAPEDTYAATRLAELHLQRGDLDAAFELGSKIDGAYVPHLEATLRLSRNDPRVLPAVTGVRLAAEIDKTAA